ncbi:nuclear pore membrane glycoprotein 210-like isoform X1 [Clavelina lepadiformis]|uniref:nuclear pore membrane glycoprotein 210-like isoform X1 n=1 Tax=Clavelina lepadiformis TaxID=159417 RepID=UPI0040411228
MWFSMLLLGLLCIGALDAFIVPKLLLPYYDQVQVNYTLNSEEGCYKWKSLNPSIASIKPISGHDASGCSSSAVVFVESRVPSRKITLVLAESEHTGSILQCDVIVDRIHAIDIISRTRELYLEDPPETLKIRALDTEGNTFSSTAGMILEWSLISDSEAKKSRDTVMPAHTILSIERFIDTMYNAETYVEELERKGQQSDTILVSGLQTGTAFVTAQLTSTMDVQSAEVRLTVRDKVFLNPNGDVWLAAAASIRYIVEQWRNGRSTEIKMPNTQYFLELSPAKNSAVTLDIQTSTVIGHHIGHSRLSLMDKNLKQQTVQGTSDIHVVDPAYLKFSIQPDNRWVLETGRHYTIIVEMYDSDNHRLWPATNIRIMTDLDKIFFKTLASTKNGTWHNVQAITKGSVNLYAKLEGIVKQDGSMKQYTPDIEVYQPAEIFDPISVIPPVVIFPWNPHPVLYKYQLTAEGGSGNYSWFVDTNPMIIVSNTGLVMTKTEKLRVNTTGSVSVRASDVRNPSHWGTSEVMILPVVQILFAKSSREAEIGNTIDLYITMNAQVKNVLLPVVDCRESKIMWKIHDPSIFEDIADFKVPINNIPDASACVGRRFRGLKEGHTTISVSYMQYRKDGTSIQLDASVTVAAFPALKAIDPVLLAVVSLDSTATLQFTGGPNRWPHWHAGYERSAVISSNELIAISTVYSFQQEHHIVSRCLRLGEVEFKLSVYNKPCNTNPFPVKSTISVRVSCAVPSRTELAVPPMLSSCPLRNIHGVQTVAFMNRPLPINVTAFDAHGNMFDNFSSIFLHWSSDAKGAQFGLSKSYYEPVDISDQKKHIVSRTVDLPNVHGEKTILVAFTKYKENIDKRVCKLYDCSKLSPTVSGSIGILVVDEPSLSPSQLVLYNHANSSADIQVLGGSGYFYHKILQDGNSSAISSATNNLLKIFPVRPGKSKIEITDHCMDYITIATADVTVVEVGSIQLEAPSRMELRSWGQISMQIVDNYGQDLSTRFFSFISLHLTSSTSDIILMNTIFAAPGHNLVAHSDITAENVGSTTLVAVATLKDGRVVTSNSVRVVVFPVLELLPPVVTLVRHASYQLRIRGGPRSDFTIEYIISKHDGKESIVNVSQSGLVHALQLGEVFISAQAKMHDGNVFHCKAPSKVKVIQLTGIHIVAPLTRFHVGGTVPIHVAGIVNDEQSPLSFGNAIPGLVFNWKLANPSVARFHTVHAKAGVETPSSLSFTMLAEGLSAGHCVVSVIVQAQDRSLQQLSQIEFYAEVTLMIYDHLRVLFHVHDPLYLIKTSEKKWSSKNNFLMATSTSHQLHTNRDGIAVNVQYEVLTNRRCDTESTPEGKDCVAVDKNGILTSFSEQCEATVLITSVERFEINQTLVLHILVRPVSYIIARSVTSFRTRDNLKVEYAFPLFSKLHFLIDQFDDTGSKFDATGHSLLLGQNRHDLIEVEPGSGNRSFKVQTPQEGITIMSAASYLESAMKPAAVYYFPINVQSAILPSKHEVIVGVGFCFMSNFVNQNGSNGVWSVHHPTLVIDKNSGRGFATAKTTTTVKYVVDSFTAEAQVVASAFVASFARQSVPKEINFQREEWIFPIIITNKQQSGNCPGLDEEMDSVASKLFLCTAKFRRYADRHFFKVEVKYVKEIDCFACILARNEIHEDRSTLATMDDHLIVSLSARSTDIGLVRDGQVILAVVPFFVGHLSSGKLLRGSHVNLCIKATPTVYESIQVTTKPPEKLLIEEESDYCFRVSASGDFIPQTVEIHLQSQLTFQDELLELHLENGDGNIAPSSPSCPSEQGPWRGANDVVESYLAYITTAAVVVISTAMLIAAFSVFKWATSNTVHPPSSSFLSRTPPPYDATSPLSSPLQGSPGSSPRVKLWSRFYEPQQAGPRTG